MKYILFLSFIFCAGLAAAASEPGLRATYFDQVDFTGASHARIEANIDFTWTGSTPEPGVIDPEFWSAVWVGGLVIPADGEYVFWTRSDDGVRLSLGDQAVIENWTGHAPTWDTGSVHLNKGIVPIDLRYYNSHGGATLRLEWSGPGIERQVVPPSAFLQPEETLGSGTGTGLHGRYYANPEFVGVFQERLDGTIHFDWGERAPLDGISRDLFSVIWEGFIEVPYTDEYALWVSCDDGVEVSIDGQPIIAELEYQAQEELSGRVHLVAGRRHEIRIRYRQVRDDAHIGLRWSSALVPKDLVPSHRLYPKESLGQETVDIDIEVSAISYVSPVTISGSGRHSWSTWEGSLNGNGVQITRSAGGRWRADVDVVDGGLPLLPGDNQFRVLQPGLTEPLAQVGIRWDDLDLCDLPYGMDRHLARLGDRMRLLARTQSGLVPLVWKRPDGTELNHIPVGDPDVFEVRFDLPGKHRFEAVSEGVQIGALEVVVPALEPLEPLAGEIAYRRRFSWPIVAGHPADVWIGSSDPGFLEVVRDPSSGPSSFFARALRHGDLAIEARLGGPAGAVIDRIPFREFTLRTSAESSITVVETYPDGTMLTEATLTMTPLVQDVEVELSMYTGGTTFENGKTKWSFPSEDFQGVPDGIGTFVYRLIRGARPGTPLCHSTRSFQDGILIGSH